MKHTPGPWKVIDGETRIHAKQVYAEATGQHVVIVTDHITHPDRLAANADLIAAAPELLEALKMALLANELTTGMTYKEIEQVHTVIAKAEGNGRIV